MIIVFSVGVIISYLMGSICSAVLVSNIFKLPDPRQSGSNNPGATNVLRLSGKKYAIIVLLADVFKGLLPVAIANLCNINPITLSCMALAAVVCHIYPVFFKFKGGKGVATAIVVLFGLNIIILCQTSFFLSNKSINALVFPVPVPPKDNIIDFGNI